MHTRYLDSIKSFEGFTPEAKWDYAQFTNGFGTKAQYPGEAISREEAERRFLTEIEHARQFVEKHACGWDEGTKAALTSLTFNAGKRWASSGLGEAVRSFDIDAVRSRFLAYTKAGGEDLPGLVRRRLAEVVWIGEGRSPPPASEAQLPSMPPPTPTADRPAGASDPKPVAIARPAAPLAGRQSTTADLPPIRSSAAEQAIRADAMAWLLILLESKLSELQAGSETRRTSRTL